MAYRCPRCGEPIRRRPGKFAAHFGLVGLLLSMPVNSFECNTRGESQVSIVAEAKPGTCGIIDRSEFPADDRYRMRMESVLSGIGAIALLVVVVWFAGSEH